MADDHLLNLQPGTVVNGRYEIVKCLGAGSMGMVYACRHRELAGHLVAMKVLFTEVARDAVQAARFRNEIVASYGVNHPNVVRAYEYFRDGDLIAFTMEYVSGGDLADRISMEQPMSIPEIARMLSQMASGMAAVHAARIVHRDLKPENILLTAQGDVKITDFGIARTGTGPRLTEHGGVVGTIDYVSPEYLERGQVDARSDIYALGILGYEMVTGETPFKGKSVIETMTMRLKSDPLAPHTLRPDCPVGLSDIILRAMARDPERRYQSCEEMTADLNALASGATPHVLPMRATAAVETGPQPVVTPQNAAHVGSGVQRVGPQPRASIPRGTPGVKKAGKREGIEPMEPLLRPRPELNVLSGASGEAGPGPSIAISNSHLSAERLRALSEDLQSDDSMFKTIVWCVVITLIGFAVGLFVLNKVITRESPQPVGMPVQELDTL